VVHFGQVGTTDKSAEVPDDVRKLLADRISGFEALEVLLLLCGEPDRAWTPTEAADALRLPGNMIAPAMDDLHACALIAPDGERRGFYRFKPATPELRAACNALCAVYAEDRMRIVMLMSRLAFERIRRSTARVFADAFRIRKPVKGEDPDA
jgi:hypothetical protein